MLWSKTIFSALTLSLLLGAGAAGAASKAPVVKEVENRGEIVLYQPEGEVRLEVRVENETVWLTQAQMAELFHAYYPRRDRMPVQTQILKRLKQQAH